MREECAKTPITKDISVVGYDGVDITVAIAKAFVNLKQPVVIQDRSPEMDVIRAFAQDENAVPVIERYGIVVTKDVTSILQKEEGTLCLTYYGRDVKNPFIATHKGIRIMTTDMYAEHAKALSYVPKAMGMMVARTRLTAKPQIEVVDTEGSEQIMSSDTVVTTNGYSKDAVTILPDDTVVIKEEPKEAQRPKKEKKKSVEKEPVVESCIGEQMIVFKSFVPIKYGTKYLLSLINRPDVRNHHIIAFEKRDLEMRVSIGHENLILSRVSDPYRAVLNTVVSKAYGSPLTKEQIKTMYR